MVSFLDNESKESSEMFEELASKSVFSVGKLLVILGCSFVFGGRFWAYNGKPTRIINNIWINLKTNFKNNMFYLQPKGLFCKIVQI